MYLLLSYPRSLVTYVDFKRGWKHLMGLPLANPEFGHPDRIDVLLGVDVFIDVQAGRFVPQVPPLLLDGFSLGP